MHARSAFLALLAGVTLATLATRADAEPRYEIVDLGPFGGTYSYAVAVNELGVVAGTSTTFNGLHAYLYQDGAMVDLGTPTDFNQSVAQGLNDAGQLISTSEGQYQGEFAYLWEQGAWTPLGSHGDLPHARPTDIDGQGRIVGFSYELGGDYRAFLWEDGAFADLPTLGDDAQALAMNESGLIVGLARDTGGDAHPVYWDDAGVHDLGFAPGADAGRATDVNDSGLVCGYSTTFIPPYFFSSHRACVWENGVLTALDNPYGGGCAATAVNNHGAVVGHVTSLTGPNGPALLWENGSALTLNALIEQGTGWDLLVANDINDSGIIVGYGEVPNGDLHGFVLLPVTRAEDLTGDGSVGQDDLGVLLAAYGVDDGGDIDDDGDTDQADLGALLSAFGGDCP